LSAIKDTALILGTWVVYIVTLGAAYFNIA
jgi:hypothetical protein